MKDRGQLTNTDTKLHEKVYLTKNENSYVRKYCLQLKADFVQDYNNLKIIFTINISNNGIINRLIFRPSRAISGVLMAAANILISKNTIIIIAIIA